MIPCSFFTRVLHPQNSMFLTGRSLLNKNIAGGKTPVTCRSTNHQNNLLYGLRTFKTSPASHVGPAIGPVLVKLAQPLYRFGFVYLGRRIRRYWNNLPPEKKVRYTKVLTKSKRIVYGGALLAGGLCTFYFVSHLEEAPVTHRRRFMILNSDQMEKVAAEEWRELDESMATMKLPFHHPLYQKVYQITKRILLANQSKVHKQT